MSRVPPLQKSKSKLLLVSVLGALPMSESWLNGFLIKECVILGGLSFFRNRPGFCSEWIRSLSWGDSIKVWNLTALINEQKRGFWGLGGLRATMPLFSNKSHLSGILATWFFNRFPWKTTNREPNPFLRFPDWNYDTSIQSGILICRAPSYKAIPTEVAKLRLLASGFMGIFKTWSGFARSRDSGKPRDSLPKTKKSPSAKVSSQ